MLCVCGFAPALAVACAYGGGDDRIAESTPGGSSGSTGGARLYANSGSNDPTFDAETVATLPVKSISLDTEYDWECSKGEKYRTALRYDRLFNSGVAVVLSRVNMILRDEAGLNGLRDIGFSAC